MLRVIAVAVMVMASPFEVEPPSTTTQTWTGWFSDKQCARVRADEEPRPNGTPCVRKCLDEGSTPVFISEQARAVYEVRGYSAVKEDVGFRVELTGEVDEQAKTVAVTSVKRLSEVTSSCLLPRKRRS
jgi:hypothetical protein